MPPPLDSQDRSRPHAGGPARNRSRTRNVQGVEPSIESSPTAQIARANRADPYDPINHFLTGNEVAVPADMDFANINLEEARKQCRVLFEAVDAARSHMAVVESRLNLLTQVSLDDYTNAEHQLAHVYVTAKNVSQRLANRGFWLDGRGQLSDMFRKIAECKSGIDEVMAWVYTNYEYEVMQTPGGESHVGVQVLKAGSATEQKPDAGTRLDCVRDTPPTEGTSVLPTKDFVLLHFKSFLFLQFLVYASFKALVYIVGRVFVGVWGKMKIG
ncbi:hypothetical protein PGQ11_002549 [Apiospora arundinis]|uniref:Uncharacterized protein n=1 Tax=Apiospora arundinis TaxID=335852 RepID=A0ABR2JIH8_9PEZI